MKRKPSNLRPALLALLGITGSLLLGAPVAAQVATPQGQMLQQPLQVGGAGVPPNFVFTLDDSGSMWWECVPDDLCSPGSYGLEAIPKRDAVSTANRLGTVVYDDVDITETTTKKNKKTGKTEVTVSTKWSHKDLLLSRRMRASAYNPLYYDPAIRYQPWIKADGTRWPNSNPSAAKVMPDSNVTQNLEGVQTVTSKWCTNTSTSTSTSSCYDKTEQTAHIARYYTMSGDGSKTSDFTLVKIESGKTYTKAEGRDDCAGTVCTYKEEIQNFANWYTYYRTRALTAIAGTAEGLVDLPESFRVGYGRINNTKSTSIDGVDTNTLERGVRAFAGQDKADFYTWLFDKTQPSGNTPLRRAMDDVGQYFERTDNKGPWGADPGKDDPTPHAACRRSIHLLMTDGMWNSSAASTSDARQNVDNTEGPKITGPGGQEYQYKPTSPYKDDYSNTLADVAMYYWSRDLRPDLSNEIKPITTTGRENPAFWQHMTNFTIAFGVDGTLNNPQDLDALKSGAKSWPSTGSSGGGAETIDDLWHAAINSRGRALSARNSTEYADAIRSVRDELMSMEGNEAGIGVSTTTLPPVGGTSKMYTPMFATPGWNGDVLALGIDSTGEVKEEAWSAAAKMPAAADRKIYTWDPEAVNKGIEFKWSKLSSTMQEELTDGASGGEALLNYLRGNRTGEGTTYRERVSVLGDIVNSTPAFVHDLVDSFFQYLPAKTTSLDYGAESYRRYLETKKLREPHIVTGANDGMLHMFRDSDGVEAFAFVPRPLYPSLAQLANKDYTHRYFVDGPIYEADVYDQANARWTNIVQGFGGAGGKYLYTIRMPVPEWQEGSNTAPAALNAAQSAPGASDILWQVDSQTDGFEELGHVVTTPETGVLRDGTWVTIFGNGYESASYKAQLFVVNALTGALIKKIDTGAGSASTRNGLGGVGVVRDAQQRIVAAYAGDLQGNLWKFDLSSASSADWEVAFGGQPLFKAKIGSSLPEPITAKPNFRAFPTGGVMVLFGTGKIFAQGDQTDTNGRALYGIWDKVKIGTRPEQAEDQSEEEYQDYLNSLRVSADDLVPQTTVVDPLSSGGLVYRRLTITPVDYANKRGWRLPLVIANGERMVDEPEIRFGSVFMQSLTPTNTSDDCQSARLIRRGYLLDPFMSGRGQPPFNVLDADGQSVGAYIVDLKSPGKNTILVHSTQSPKTGIIKGAERDRGIEVNFGDDLIRRYWRQVVTPPTQAAPSAEAGEPTEAGEDNGG